MLVPFCFDTQSTINKSIKMQQPAICRRFVTRFDFPSLNLHVGFVYCMKLILPWHFLRTFHYWKSLQKGPRRVITATSAAAF